MTVRLLHQIGARINPNFNTLEEILACNEPLHFDGVYTSVWENYQALKGKDVTFFISGAYLGKTNAFDISQPISKFCNIRQVEHMAQALNARIGWHGKRHKSCKGMHPIDVQEELTLPDWWSAVDRTAKILAWPYGDFDQDSIWVARRLGFEEAWSVTQGNDSVLGMTKRREHLNW